MTANALEQHVVNLQFSERLNGCPTTRHAYPSLHDIHRTIKMEHARFRR